MVPIPPLTVTAVKSLGSPCSTYKYVGLSKEMSLSTVMLIEL